MQLLNWYKRLGSSTTGIWVARKRGTQRKDPSQKPLKLPATRPKKFPTLNNLYSLPNALFSYAPSILLLEIYIPNATNATHVTSKYQADLQNEESPKVIFGTFFLFLARLGRRQSLSLIHLSNLLWPCRVVGTFVISDSNKPWEAEGYTPIVNLCCQSAYIWNVDKISTAHQTLGGWVYRTQTEISGQYFPNDLWFEPNIRFCATNFQVASRFRHFQWIEGLVM